MVQFLYTQLSYMTNNQQQQIKQVKYLVLGEEEVNKKIFIDSINKQNGQNSLAITTLKGRQDPNARATLISIPMSELHRVKQYRGNCQGVIIMLSPEQTLCLKMYTQKFNISKQIIQAYCQLFQKQLDNNSNIKSSKLKTRRQKYPKLIICSFNELDVPRSNVLFSYVYSRIQQINGTVWNYLEENNCRYFIFDQTYDWVIKSNQRQSNFDLIKQQLNMNDYCIRSSTEQISQIYQQSQLVAKKSKYRPRQEQGPNRSSLSRSNKNYSQQDAQYLNQRKSLSQMPSNQVSREEYNNNDQHQGQEHYQAELVLQKKHCTCSIQ